MDKRINIRNVRVRRDKPQPPHPDNDLVLATLVADAIKEDTSGVYIADPTAACTALDLAWQAISAQRGCGYDRQDPA